MRPCPADVVIGVQKLKGMSGADGENIRAGFRAGKVVSGTLENIRMQVIDGVTLYQKTNVNALYDAGA